MIDLAIFSPTHVHKESGNLYEYIFTTNLTANDPIKWPKMIVYRNSSLEVFSKPETEFHDRFMKYSIALTGMNYE